MYVFECASCGCLAPSERSDALTCSPACRVRAHRNGLLKPIRDVAHESKLTPAQILRGAAASELWGVDEAVSRMKQRDGETSEECRARWQKEAYDDYEKLTLAFMAERQEDQTK